MNFAIEVEGLVKVYDGKVRALDGVDLKVKAGNVFALLGPNGSGKTTLIRILTTQFKPTSGEASIFGFNVVRRRILKSGNLSATFPMSVQSMCLHTVEMKEVLDTQQALYHDRYGFIYYNPQH